jgi:hypothetical protein
MFPVNSKSREDETLFGRLNTTKSKRGNKEKGWLRNARIFVRLWPVIQGNGLFLPENMIAIAMFANDRTPQRSATRDIRRIF